MGDLLFVDKVKHNSEFSEMKSELDESVRKQQNSREQFGRLTLDASEDAVLIETTALIEKSAKRLQASEKIREREADLTELDTQMFPLEESDKHRKNRLDAVAKTKSANKDVDHVSLALRWQILVSEKEESDSGKSPAEQLNDCVQALSELNPEADFTGEDYLTEHADELFSLIKNGEAFMKLSQMAREGKDLKLIDAFAGLSKNDVEIYTFFGKMAASAKSAMEKLCLLKGIDPSTGDFREKALSRKVKNRLKEELAQDRKKMKESADEADSRMFEMMKTGDEKQADAEQKAKRKQALDAAFAARKEKKERTVREARARQRLQSLVEKYQKKIPKQEWERTDAEINRLEQGIIFHVEDERTTTHLLLSVDILRSMGRQLDSLKERLDLEDECLDKYYRKEYGEDPDEAVKSLFQQRCDEALERENEYTAALSSLKSRLETVFIPLSLVETQSSRREEDDRRMQEALNDLSRAEKKLSPAKQRRIVRNRLVRQKRALTLQHLEERQKANIPGELAVEKRLYESSKIRGRAGIPDLDELIDIDFSNPYAFFEYRFWEKYPDEPIPSAEDLEKIVHDYLRTVMQKNTSMQIRVPDCEILGRILDFGRFKSLMETGTSGGATDQNLRKNFAATKFGIDPAAFPNSDYEVYGYLSDGDLVREGHLSDDGRHLAEDNVIGAVGMYGQVIVKLKAHRMMMRTSVVFGDSLDNRTSCSPAMLDNPDSFSVSGADRYRVYEKAYEWYRLVKEGDEDGAAEMANLHSFMEGMYRIHYTELQFHGGVSVDDIESVTLVPKLRLEGEEDTPEDKDIPDEVLVKLQKRGIRAYVLSGGEIVEKQPAASASYSAPKKGWQEDRRQKDFQEDGQEDRWQKDFQEDRQEDRRQEDFPEDKPMINK